MGRAIATWVLALIVLSQGSVVAQTIEAKAMTKDEIEKELKSASQFTGTVSLNGNPLCSFDSNKAQSLPLGYFNRNEPKPSSWAVVTATPALVITLSTDVPNRVTLTKLGAASDSKLIAFQKTSSTRPVYNLGFLHSPGSIDSPGFGDYEFGTTKGTIALFFRCGFTIQEKAP